MSKYNGKIINANKKEDFVKKYGNSEAWKIYCSKIQRNPFVRILLFQKYHGICQFCGKPLKDNFVIHHMTYDKECINPTLIEIPHPTEKRPNRVYKVPDCERCQNVEDCTSFLRPVCSICNMIIEKIALANSNLNK